MQTTAVPPARFLSLLRDFTDATGLPAPEPDAQGEYTLMFGRGEPGDERPVNLAADPHGDWLTVYAPLAAPGENPHPAALRHTLAEGYFAVGARIVACLDPHGRQLALSTTTSLANLDGAALLSLLEAFHDRLRAWPALPPPHAMPDDFPPAMDHEALLDGLLRHWGAQPPAAPSPDGHHIILHDGTLLHLRPRWREQLLEIYGRIGDAETQDALPALLVANWFGQARRHSLVREAATGQAVLLCLVSLHHADLPDLIPQIEQCAHEVRQWTRTWSARGTAPTVSFSPDMRA